MGQAKYLVSAYCYGEYLGIVRLEGLHLSECKYIEYKDGLYEDCVREPLQDLDGIYRDTDLFGEFTPMERWWLSRHDSPF